jgi:hypothetical protein
MPRKRSPKLLKIKLPTETSKGSARLSPAEQKHLYFVITSAPHPAGVTASIYYDKPNSPVVRHKPVNSPASALKGRPTVTPVKTQRKAKGSAPKRKRAGTSISQVAPESAVPQAKRRRLSITAPATAPAVAPIAALLNRAENTSVKTFFSAAQVSWAKAMLSSYIEGLNATKNSLVARLELLFPQMTELDCDQVTPLPDDPVLKAIIEGASMWESEHVVTKASWDDMDRASEVSITVINGLLNDITDLRYMIRAAHLAVQNGESGVIAPGGTCAGAVAVEEVFVGSELVQGPVLLPTPVHSPANDVSSDEDYYTEPSEDE